MMRRYSPQYYSPPRRGYGGRGRSPPRRGYGGGGGGGYGRRKEQAHGSLLIRNIPLDCRAEELRVPFERFGLVRDVYIPKDYYTGDPRGFAFVEFVDPYDAADAQYHMDGQVIAGRRISVVVAAESRKRPEEMRRRTTRPREPLGYGSRRPAYRGRSRSRSISRSRSPPYPSRSEGRRRSRSYSPAPRRHADYSASPQRRHGEDQLKSPRGPPQEEEGGHRGRSYSPGYSNGYDQDNDDAGKPKYESEEGQARRMSSPGGASRSPSGSRSRSADLSPRNS